MHGADQSTETKVFHSNDIGMDTNVKGDTKTGDPLIKTSVQKTSEDEIDFNNPVPEVLDATEPSNYVPGIEESKSYEKKLMKMHVRGIVNLSISSQSSGNLLTYFLH